MLNREHQSQPLRHESCISNILGQTLSATTHYGENKPDPSGGRNREETLEVDRTHIEESIQLRHNASPHMECSRPKEKKRKTKEHITLRNRDRHEKNEQKLDRTGKEGGGQSRLKNAGQQPMLHRE
ncbi:unnamed protein product [Schistosoma margrebowiei]|uniref:Uncharacterized protein n=1 Tax=Schistosoma margrebowiei TaxID=48269 RepID=A0A183LZV6_9TREM|nr:unnamed protein product [Schistosoma margrebowiei]